MNKILIKPIITEKSNIIQENLNKISFVVDKRANKIQIKDAIEKMYGVSVESVNTNIVPGKTRSRFTKSGIQVGRKSGYKKAVATLAKGEEIDFYANV